MTGIDIFDIVAYFWETQALSSSFGWMYGIAGLSHQLNQDRADGFYDLTGIPRLSELREHQGHEATDAIDDIDAAAAVEQNADGVLGARLALDDHLTATATWADRLVEQLAVGASGGDGQDGDGDVGILGTCGEEGSALGTETGGVGSVLLVAADDLGAILQTDGSTHAEAGVGGIAATGGLDGEVEQMLFFNAQFLRLADLNDGF